MVRSRQTSCAARQLECRLTMCAHRKGRQAARWCAHTSHQQQQHTDTHTHPMYAHSHIYSQTHHSARVTAPRIALQYSFVDPFCPTQLPSLCYVHRCLLARQFSSISSRLVHPYSVDANAAPRTRLRHLIALSSSPPPRPHDLFLPRVNTQLAVRVLTTPATTAQLTP